MSSPQVENGFTRIANELLDQILLAPLRGQQMKIIFFLIRKTYGYGKKSDKLSLQQWADGIGIERHNVWRELQGLIDGNMIHVQDNGPKRPKTYSVNKDYETWFAQSVVASDDKSVVADDYSSTQSVVADDYKSVVTPHESTKERKKAEAATTAKPKPTISDFVSAYQSVWGMMVSSAYIGEEIQDWEKRITLEGWRYALKECADTRNVGNWKYLRKILERIERDGYLPQPQAVPVMATVDFALEELI
jgi:phage replication O-like protein O